MTTPEKLSRFDRDVSPHLKSAYNLARWLTGSHEDAEDVVQEAFLRAFAAFEGFRGGDSKAWLLAIVRNTSITWLKKNRSAPIAEPRMDPADPSPDPEQILRIASNRTQVRHALEQMPWDFREAVVLREMEGLSYKEISAAIGVPVGTVMSRLSRGRDWLKRTLTRSQEGAA